MTAAWLKLIEGALDEILPREEVRPVALSSAMRHALNGGGKRIRPLICLASAVAAGGKAEDAVWPACAIELLHNYTLVHDDLPAMDNDAVRRGRPSVWAKFGEANGILAGDALQSLAFAAAARAPRNVAAIVSVLAEKGVGVVAGQVEDLGREGMDADYVYLHKTGDLFIAAATMGALAAGGSGETVNALAVFARHLGLAFQYEDDLLDGDGAYPPEETSRRAVESTSAALAALEGLPGDVTQLKTFASRLLGRKN